MVRFGIVGTGNISQKFYEANRYTGEFELVAVYSRSAEKGKEFAFRKGDLKIYDDFEEFADSDLFEAVYIASPNCCHYEQTMRLLAAGKHVLCEKPMASNLSQAKEMFRMAREKGLVLMEAMRSFYTPGFLKMIPHMEGLGKIRRATFIYCQYSSRYDNFRRGIIENAFRPELSNGALMDIGIYPIECMIRLFGKPDRVLAMGIRLFNGVDGEGTILMEYKDMMAEVIYSKITNSMMPSQIQGEDGSMLITEIHNVKDLHIRRKSVNQTIHFEQSDNTLNYETAHFIRMIRGEEDMEEAASVTLDALRVIDEAKRQIGIHFPADEEKEC